MATADDANEPIPDAPSNQRPRLCAIGLVVVHLLLTLTAVLLFLAGYAVSQVDRLHRTTWWSSLGPDTYPSAYLYLIGWYAVIVYASLAILREAA